MENNRKHFLSLLFLIIFSLFTFNLFAQDSDSPEEGEQTEKKSDDSYYLKDSDEGLVFVQKFSWDAIEGAFKYVFTIEQKAVIDKKASKKNKDEDEPEINEDGYIPVDIIETEKNFVELSLLSGTYRYNIAVYNFLGYAEFESDWFNVDIYKAYQPEVKDINPKNLFLEEEQNGQFTVTGTNLREGAVYSLKAGGRQLEATVIEQDAGSRHVKLQIDPKILETGVYTLYATNIGGLQDTISPVTIKFKKPMDFDIGVGYAPFMFLYDNTIKEYYGNSFYPLGAGLKMVFYPLKFKLGYFGIGLAGYGTYTNYQFSGFSVKSHFADANLLLSYQKVFNFKKGLFRSLHLEVHGGAGLFGILGTQYSFPHDVKSDPLWSLNICATAGVSLQLYVLNRLYLELGADFVHAFMKSMMTGYVRPVASVGWQF